MQYPFNRAQKRALASKKGTYKRRIISVERTENGRREFEFHATKGCRSYRIGE